MSSSPNLILPNTEPYNFPAMFIVNNEDGTWHLDSLPIDFKSPDDALKPWLHNVWKDMRNAVQKSCELQNSQVPSWSKWSPWQWCYPSAKNITGRTPILAFVDGTIVGFLTLWRTSESPETVYIEHVGAIPGSIDTVLWKRRFVHLGASLMAFAIHTSKENGLGGRVGLHAMDDTVLNGVYRKLAKKVPGLFAAERTNVKGPMEYWEKSMSLTYLETTESGAAQFLEGFRDA